MRRRLLAVPAVLAALAAAAPASAPAAAPPFGGLTLVQQVQLDPRLSELTFTTPSLAAPVKVRVLVPAGAAAHPEERFPSLYLLHGSDGDASAWTDQGDAEELTDGLGLVVVMPDGGAEGWYTNWPRGNRPRWEDFHIDQLIPWIDAHEPTIAARGERAIAGLSMGGFGAMSYAARHPDRFAAAASFSGAVDLGTPAGSAPSVVGAEPWGPWNADGGLAWRGHNPVQLAGNLRGLALSIFTGNGRPPEGGGPVDGIEPTIEAQSKALAARLAQLRIPRVFDDYGPGRHEWTSWSRDLQRTLPGLMDVFAHPPALPSPFSFTATERRFAIRGYSVRAARDRLAFRTISDVGAGGFTYTGDGASTVTTAGRYTHRARYRIRVRAHGRLVAARAVRASAGGRLTVRVPGTAVVGITREHAES